MFQGRNLNRQKKISDAAPGVRTRNLLLVSDSDEVPGRYSFNYEVKLKNEWRISQEFQLIK